MSKVRPRRIDRHLVVWLILYRLSLDLVYALIIAPSYWYYGFKFAPSGIKIAASWFVFLLFSLFVKRQIRQPLRVSGIVILTLFSMSFIPTSSLYCLGDLQNEFFFYLVLYWGLILAFAWVCSKSAIDRVSFVSGGKHRTIKAIALEALTWLFGVYVFMQSFRYNRLKINLGIENVYELRTAASEADFGSMGVYLLTWSAVVFCFAALRYFEARKWLRFIVFCYLQLLLFSINGMKTTLFFIPIALVGYKYIKTESISYLPLGLAFLNVVSLSVFYIFKAIILTGLTAFRLYFLPALISYEFFDFFSTNPPDMLAQSVLRRFGVKSRYDLPIPYLIDSVYGDGTGSANTGMFGDAFSNFGPMGAIIYPFLLVGALKLLDIASVRLELKSYIAIILIVTIAFTNVAFFTALLSNGILLAILMLILQKRPRHSMPG